MTTRSRLRTVRSGGESGAVAGTDVLPGLVLVLVIGTLAIVNLWAVLDAKHAASIAAREAVHAYVESDSPAAAPGAAMATARATLTDLGHPLAAIDVPKAADFSRCTRVTVTVRTRVPALSLPFGIGLGRGMTVTARDSELVDPFRSADGLPEGDGCG